MHSYRGLGQVVIFIIVISSNRLVDLRETGICLQLPGSAYGDHGFL
jgi:hypothetical protein